MTPGGYWWRSGVGAKAPNREALAHCTRCDVVTRGAAMKGTKRLFGICDTCWLVLRHTWTDAMIGAFGRAVLRRQETTRIEYGRWELPQFTKRAQRVPSTSSS